MVLFKVTVQAFASLQVDSNRPHCPLEKNWKHYQYEMANWRLRYLKSNGNGMGKTLLGPSFQLKDNQLC